MAFGLSLNDLTKSLETAGSASGDLVTLSMFGRDSESIPLVDYGDFSNHMIFGDAKRRSRIAIQRMVDDYPIGKKGGFYSNTASLSSFNIYEVDKYIKESNGFDLWILDQFGKSSTAYGAAEKALTAAATNEYGETVPLIIVHRDQNNLLHNTSQTAMEEYITILAEKYEDESTVLIDRTPGTGTSIFVTADGGVESINLEYGNQEEVSVNRNNAMKNMLPEIMFLGDDEENIENLLAIVAEQFDELQTYIDQIEHIKTISYDDKNRIPDKMLPLLANEYGIELFESAGAKSIDRWLSNSSSGATSREINYQVWKRILNSVVSLLKTKGTKDNLNLIKNAYGVNNKFLKSDEYSIFNKQYLVSEVDEVDVPAFYGDGTAYVRTVAGNNKSSRVFDFVANQDFTIEMRVAASAKQTHMLMKNPSFEITLNDQGRVRFLHLIDGSVDVQTPQGSLSSLIQSQDTFFNVAVTRQDDDLTVYTMALSASPTGGTDQVFVEKNSLNLAQISDLSFDTAGATVNPPGGSSTFETYFPGRDGDFNGFMQEVRVWSAALSEEDLKQHTRNFESITFQSSTGTPYFADWYSLSAQWKLKENVVLADPFNYIQNSATAEASLYNSNTAEPVNFGVDKRYKTFTNLKKINEWYPAGFNRDNDKVIYEDGIEDELEDSSYVSMHFTPIETLNSFIKNSTTKLNLPRLLGNADQLYDKKYSGEFSDLWHDIIKRHSTSGESVFADIYVNDVLTQTELENIKRGNSSRPLVDINTFIKAMGNFNDVLGGIFNFSEQFLPAKSSLLSKGVLVEPHILERSKMERRIGFRKGTDDGYIGEPDSNPTNIDVVLTVEAASNGTESTTLVVPNTSALEVGATVSGTNIEPDTTIDSITDGTTIELSIAHAVFSSDEDITFTLPLKSFPYSSPGEKTFSREYRSSDSNIIPNVTVHRDSQFNIVNKYIPSALEFQDSSSTNIVALHPTASTTAHFQGYKYQGIQPFLNRSLTSERSLPSVTKFSTTNSPRISDARVAKLLPVNRTPANPEETEIDVTLDNLIINPTVSPTAAAGFISGRVRLLSKGLPFNSETPTFRFEFPTSADGTNLFIAEMGDLDAGLGRIIENIDNTFVTNVNKNDVQMRLTLNSVVTSLSAVGPGVTENMVNDSKQGSLGVLPIRITNLFNDNTQIVRVAINAIENDNADILTQLADQGGVTLES